MFYTVYKITNWYNGKIYVGVHKTNNLDDGYMGSGLYIKRAIKTYGLGYFTKEYLAFFDNPKDMYKMEADIVNKDFIKRKDTYNLKVGGFGGFDYINSNPALYITEKRLAARGPEWKEKISITLKIKYKTDLSFRKRVIDNSKKACISCKEKYPQGTFKGKTHTDETKQKMSKTAKERLKDPRNNTQFGTMWITDGINNKKILKDSDIPDGWRKGRVIPKVLPI